MQNSTLSGFFVKGKIDKCCNFAGSLLPSTPCHLTLCPAKDTTGPLESTPVPQEDPPPLCPPPVPQPRPSVFAPFFHKLLFMSDRPPPDKWLPYGEKDSEVNGDGRQEIKEMCRTSQSDVVWRILPRCFQAPCELCQNWCASMEISLLSPWDELQLLWAVSHHLYASLQPTAAHDPAYACHILSICCALSPRSLHHPVGGVQTFLTFLYCWIGEGNIYL